MFDVRAFKFKTIRIKHQTFNIEEPEKDPDS